MRRVLELFSILAVGFFVAGALGVAALDDLPLGRGGIGGGKIDFGSLGLGLVLGVVITTIARVGWSEIPRRFVAWLVACRGTFRLLAWGLAFAAVLVLY
jgi:hypothetical protein